MSNVLELPHGVEEPFTPSSEEEVVELSFLLPGWQVTKLESVAHQRGMTAAAMVRNLLCDFLKASVTGDVDKF
jgi:hypothetical protein